MVLESDGLLVNGGECTRYFREKVDAVLDALLQWRWLDSLDDSR
jgi:hypothetical protein